MIEKRINSVVNAENSRIIPVEGDIEKPLLGLSESVFQELADCVDTIYHAAAIVNYMYPYNILKNANVRATQDIIKLAVTKRLKRTHFISTLTVFPPRDFEERPTVYEHYEPRHAAELNMGYNQTKWVGERIIRNASERGIPVAIYRSGRICGDTKEGKCQTKDILWLIVKACIQVKSRPDDLFVNINI